MRRDCSWACTPVLASHLPAPRLPTHLPTHPPIHPLHAIRSHRKVELDLPTSVLPVVPRADDDVAAAGMGAGVAGPQDGALDVLKVRCLSGRLEGLSACWGGWGAPTLAGLSTCSADIWPPPAPRPTNQAQAMLTLPPGFEHAAWAERWNASVQAAAGDAEVKKVRHFEWCFFLFGCQC